MRISDWSSDVCSSDLRDRDRRISSNCAQNHCPHLTSVAHPLKRLVMTSELPKTFEPSAIEARWYPHWESKGLFRPERPDAQPFTIVNPPPNVTGSLHIGHALDNTLQDIVRSEEHTSVLQSLMRISYAVFCLKK